jgi:3-hydroxybutyryl-CoA dehydrogenase
VVADPVEELLGETRLAETGRAEDRPPPPLAERYQRGDLGRKTGRGWYEYPK